MKNKPNQADTEDRVVVTEGEGARGSEESLYGGWQRINFWW